MANHAASVRSQRYGSGSAAGCRFDLQTAAQHVKTLVQALRSTEAVYSGRLDATYAYTYAYQYDPLNDRYLVVWEDKRDNNTHPDIYARLLDGNSEPLGAAAEFVLDGPSSDPWHTPDVVYDPDSGDFVAVWVRAQFVATVVDVVVTNQRAFSPSLATDRQGGFLVAWRHDGNGDVVGQRVEAMANPFAVVVMAHLQTRRTRQQAQEWYAAKLKLARLLYERDYRRETILELFRFIDWVMTLPPELEEQFMTEIVAYEAQEKKPCITSVERIALQRGLEQGLEQGLERGMRTMLPETLETRFGSVPENLLTWLEQISDPDLLKQLQHAALLAGSLEAFQQQLDLKL